MSGQGVFVVLEGGEGAGKSSQIRLLHEWLDGTGRKVCVTFEPGDTAIGGTLREMLLGHETGQIAARTEALLYAADRAEHVETVIRPALDRGEVVLCDRYIDSSVAYQGAGRALSVGEVASLSSWATSGLLPQLTFVLDIDPVEGLKRSGSVADRLEAEPLAFHQQVREQFLALARSDPQRYVVIDAHQPAADVQSAIRAELEGLLR